MADREKQVRIRFDKKTKEWFRHNIMAETTVVQCEKCGLYYKPILGHGCRVQKGRASDVSKNPT